MSDLKPYAEPIVESQLRQGEIYFMLNYFDNHMLVPDMKTLIFLGKNVTGNDDSLLYFQDLNSYIGIGPYPQNTPGKGNIFQCSGDQLNSIFFLEKAMDELRRCTARREKRGLEHFEFCSLYQLDEAD